MDSISFLSETPFNLALSLTLSGCLPVLQNYGEHVTWSFDGASENTGSEFDAFCGENSPFHRLLISRDIWQYVDTKLATAGAGNRLKQFFSGEDLAGLTSECKALLRQE